MESTKPEMIQIRYDPRLNFRNLKPGRQDNPLDPATIGELWIPRIGLLNGLDEFQTVATEEDAELYRAYAWRRSKPEVSGIDEAVEGRGKLLFNTWLGFRLYLEIYSLGNKGNHKTYFFQN